MSAQYDLGLVAVSIVIAIMASYVALDLAERLRSGRSRARAAWWIGGSVAMGVGIWSMHFVGMLAFHLQMSVEYDAPLVLMSLLVAIGASAFALSVASRPVLPFSVLAVASLLMGSAISGMHYIGMAAMRLPAVLTWRPTLVIASIAIAITASFAALLLAFRLRGSGGGLFRWARTWAAMLMGVAIAGMHYTAMAAAQFTAAAADLHVSHLSLHTGGMAVAVTIGTFVILSVALAGAAIDDREQLLAREQRARHDAEAANRLKDEFLATLSHELRTPLNVIVGRTQMLRVQAEDPLRVRQTADAIAHNGELLRQLVEDLLDVSRITLGGLQLDCRPVDLPALLDAVISGVQPAAEAKGIRLRTSRVPPIPQVVGDSIRLQQVIWNLLTNAVKFTSSGGEVRAEIRRDGSDVVMTVTDSGQGIDPAFLPHVFEMFRQGESASNRTQGGLGLGLSIVQRLIELHGGTVSAASAGIGLGSVFTVSLPCQPQNDPQRELSRAALIHS